ncbi:MAG TPA: HAD family phosphatase [Candidatus Acidoferrales bacterium]|nr:HAD family phosphatase [Candidatus Acidoferrales bacterium]
MSRRQHGRPAAFFDLDGTLVPPPSLEWRLYRALRYRRVIGASQLIGWMGEAVRLLPRGPSALRHANKMYLRWTSAAATAAANSRIQFFPGALDRASEHAAEGHALVLVSGTLEPLATFAARALANELEARGENTTVEVCATRIEEWGGKWTGRVLGEPMNGSAKALAARQIAANCGYDLARSYAYGNSGDDLWLLSIVGHPAAVHPSRRLERCARQAGWPVLEWTGRKNYSASAFAAGVRKNGRQLSALEKWWPNL